jgi:23S rRNA (uracil1939-C5)-methyltransferase
LRQKKLPIFEQVTISGIGPKGKPTACVDDRLVTIDRGVPGDVVDLQITRKRKTSLEAKVIRVHQSSPRRVEPFCQHFGACGGCKWQDMPYADQLTYKQKSVWKAFSPFLERNSDSETTEPVEVRLILAAASTQFYRNKLEFTFSNRRWLSQAEIESGERFDRQNALGFHAPGMFDKVLEIETCYLQPEPSNAIRQSLRAFAHHHHLSFYDPKTHEGLLRTLMIRTASTGETMVVVAFQQDDRPMIEAVMQHLAHAFPQITSLIYTINPKFNDTLYDLEMVTWRGQAFITEVLGDLQFRIGPKSFFQTNTTQALTLYQQVAALAGLTGRETVYDLYTGTGTIANFVARQAQQVIGIEFIAEAIEDAKENSRLNGISNTQFFAGDIKAVLTPDFIAQMGAPDVLITDPPRAGMHPDVIQTILAAHPPRMVYVSCNPQTQAHDIQALQSHYRLVLMQPVDMFPQTYHVENIALLERR